jgi:pimeloyl-ACP methyl ester carboxylesterase
MQNDSLPSHKKPQRKRFGIRRLAAQLQAAKTPRGETSTKASKASSRIAALMIVLVLAVTAVCAWPFVKCHLQAAAVLDLVANERVPKVLSKIVSEPITTREFMLPTSHGAVRARLYLPIGHPNAPALVVLHGVHYLGIDEPRLVAFASAMASCGLRVLTPELPDIKDYHIGANSILTIGDAANWMSRQDNGKPVGVMGLSFSGGLSLMAAADPVYRKSIKFVVAVGSQDEMSRVAEFYTTGEDERPNGTEEELRPHEYGALVLEYENLEDFAPKSDLKALRAVLRAHLYENVPGEEKAMAALNPRQKAEADQLMDTTSPATHAMLARSEAEHVAAMAGVSPHGHLHNLTTPVYLLHGEADNIIPSAETMWMASELPSQTLKEELISPVISHLDMNGHDPTELDRLRLVHFFALVLRAAEKQ